MAEKSLSVDLTTGVGIVSFPHVFPSTASKDKKTGAPIYDVQLLIPKSDKDSARKIMAAIKQVGEAKWGERWKSVRKPLRDGDKEQNELTEDGSTKGEKYPERLGHYFINARSSKPVTVVDQSRTPILDSESDKVYPGCKARVHVTFYSYSKEGNHGVGVGLNGLQFVADGEPLGGGRPSVESMFDLVDDLDDDLDDDLVEDDEPEAEPEEKPKAKKRAAKKAPAKPKVEVEVADEDDDLVEDDEDDDLDDLDDL